MYTLKDFVRRLSPEMLKSYIEAENLNIDLTQVDQEKIVDEFNGFFEELPYSQQTKVHYHFHEVHDLANEKGVQMLLKGAPASLVNKQRKDFKDWPVCDKAMWYFLHDDAFFLNIADEFQIQNTTGWVTFRTESSNDSIDQLKERTKDFEKAISNYFYENEQRGEFCTTDVIRRDDYICFITHPQDYVQREPVYDRTTNQLNKTHLLQPTFTQYFLYRPAECRLSIKIRSGDSRRIELAGIFGEIILKQSISKENQIFYDLNLLWQPEPLPVPPPEFEFIGYTITCLRFQAKSGRGTISLSYPNRANGMDSMLPKLASHNITKELYDITEATFCVHYSPRKDRVKREKSSVTFTISLPARCNLGESPLKERSRRLLSFWGIDRQEQTHTTA